jgi:hypothetical protein
MAHEKSNKKKHTTIIHGVLLPRSIEKRQLSFRCDITHQNDLFDDFYRYNEVLFPEFEPPSILNVDGLIYTHSPWGKAECSIELAIDIAIDKYVEHNPGPFKPNVKSWR